jgi:hypothetical protein
MGHHKRFALIALLGCLMLAPAAALAGKKVSKDNESLQLTTKVTPDKAGSKGVKLHIHVEYDFTSISERQKTNNKDVRLTLPPGMKINPTAAGQCTGSAAENGTSVAACPKSSIVGSGTVTIDARPTSSKFLGGTVTLYNVKGQHHDILFWFSVKFGSTLVTGGELYRMLMSGKTEYLDYATFAPPPHTISVYTLRSADLTLQDASTGKAYVNAPATCTGSWPFSFSISNWTGAPTIGASDKASCKAH